jgi:hypothetical protein
MLPSPEFQGTVASTTDDIEQITAAAQATRAELENGDVKLAVEEPTPEAHEAEEENGDLVPKQRVQHRIDGLVAERAKLRRERDELRVALERVQREATQVEDKYEPTPQIPRDKNFQTEFAGEASPRTEERQDEINRARADAERDHWGRLEARHFERMKSVQLEPELLAQADQIPTSPEVLRAIISESNSERIVEFLIRNPQYARELEALPAGAKATTVVRIGAWLIGNQAAAQQQRRPRPVSRAPEPIRPVGMNTRNSAEEITGEESYADYRRKRDAVSRVGRRH